MKLPTSSTNQACPKLNLELTLPVKENRDDYLLAKTTDKKKRATPQRKLRPSQNNNVTRVKLN